MNFNKNKKWLMSAAVAVALLTTGANNAHAQATASIGGTVSTAAALAAAAGNDVDFGTWFVQLAGGDTPDISLGAVTAGSPALPAAAGIVDASTVVTNTVLPGAGGNVTVTSPIVSTTIQIQGNITTDFTDPTLTMTALVYTDSNVTNVAIPAAFDGATFVEAQLPAAAETIGIGGNLEFIGAGPAAATTFNDAVIQIDFSF